MADYTRQRRHLMLVVSTILLAAHTVSAATLGGHNSITPGMPRIQNLDAKCGRSGMTVKILFDQPFPGVIYSKGHFAERDCNYVTQKNTGDKEYIFLVPIDGCGTDGQLEDPTPGRDMFFENTIIVQLDPLITEAWDEARNIKCVWPHTIMKSVRASPFSVRQPERVDVELDERAVNTLMEIQVGPGPFQSPATGYLYMAEETSMVIYVQDPKQNTDVNVVNCSAKGVGGESVQLIDDYGCLLRPDMITPFDKTRKTNGVKADLMLYAYLKAFKIDERQKFSIRCQLEICGSKCTDPCSNGQVLSRRRKRSLTPEQDLTKLILGNNGDALQNARPDAVWRAPRTAAILKTSKSDAILDDSIRASISEVPIDLDNDFERLENFPSEPIELEQAVLVVEKEEIETSGSWCDLSPSLVVAGLSLLAMVAFLSLLSCYLALKLTHYNDKLTS